MQGASPLASPALDRLRHLQTLPKRHPVGWLAFFAACCPCLWLALLLPSPDPRSQSALPGGKGETKSLFRRGLRPRHPCTEPPAARTVPVVLVPGGIPCREPLPVGFAANYGFSSGDARGEAPCIRKLKVSPFPLGRGSGGWGRQRQLTAGTAGGKEGKPPLRTPQRQGQPATSRASPRIGYSNGRSSRQRKNTPSPQKKPVSLLTGFPPSCIIIMRKAGVWLGSRHLTQDLNNL